MASIIDAVLVPCGSAGAKVATVITGENDAYLHSGGFYEWDTAAPVAVAGDAGFHVSRIDGSRCPVQPGQPAAAGYPGLPAGNRRACCSTPSGKRRMRSDYLLSQLDVLEAESIHIMREVAAEFERPALLFSGGKDSIVMLALAEKAFRPANIPFPVMHVDTGHNFPEVLDFRDKRAAELGVRLVVASVQDSIDQGRAIEETGRWVSRNRLQTVTLLDAIEEHRFDALFGGARRDEEKARAKERVFSLPRRVRPVGPEEPAPRAVEPLQHADQARRAHPGVPAVELDRA